MNGVSPAYDRRQSGVKIKFLVVGGGIAGVACAYALRRSGHEVHVVEEADGLGQKAGGLRSPPNLTKILVKWGLGPELAKRALKCRGSPLIDMESGEQVGYLEWQEDVIKETGADFLMLPHKDLHRMLYDLAVDSGVTVQFNAQVVEIDPNTPSVRLRNGETLRADVLIGADGYQSRVRDAILGSTVHRATPTGMSIYTMTIPIASMRSDPELREFVDTPSFPMWMAGGRSVLGHPISTNEDYTLHLFWPDDNESSEESWTSSTPLSDLDFSAYEPRLQKMIKLASSAIRTKYMRHETIEDWVHENGKVVIIGEAAHPLLPASTHGASMAIEDAAVLGSLFSRLRSRARVASFLFAFQEVRRDRCTYAQKTELTNARVCWMAPGPERDMRDAGMRAAMQASSVSWEEEHLIAQWEMISTLMGYDAYEAAEEWWVQWGSLREKAEGLTGGTPSENRARGGSFYVIDVVQESGQARNSR